MRGGSFAPFLAVMLRMDRLMAGIAAQGTQILCLDKNTSLQVKVLHSKVTEVKVHKYHHQNIEYQK